MSMWLHMCLILRGQNNSKCELRVNEVSHMCNSVDICQCFFDWSRFVRQSYIHSFVSYLTTCMTLVDWAIVFDIGPLFSKRDIWKTENWRSWESLLMRFSSPQAVRANPGGLPLPLGLRRRHQLRRERRQLHQAVRRLPLRRPRQPPRHARLGQERRHARPRPRRRSSSSREQDQRGIRHEGSD